MPKPRVLIIDDEPSGREQLRQVAEKQPFEVVAGSVAEGLAAFDACRPDVVVLDSRLLDGPSMTAFRHIHARVPPCPIVLITDHGPTETSRAAMHEGAFAVLVRPVDLDRLMAVLEQALEATQLLVRGALLPEPSPADAGAPLRQLVAALQQTGQGDLYARVIQAVDRVVLAAVMAQTRGNQLRASEILGIDRKTLRHKLRTLGLAADKSNGLASHLVPRDPAPAPS